MRQKITVTLTSAALLVALTGPATTAASQIYKYTDADGTVHYVDRPTGAATEERVAIVSRPTDRAAVQTRVEGRLDRQQAAEDARSARADARQQEAAARAEREQRAQKCQEYRSRLETYVQSRRLYRQGEDGERIYLDDAEREAARQKVEDLVAEYCD